MISVGDNTYIGETAASSGERTYYFDISDFSKNVKTNENLSLAILIPSNQDDVSLEISEISLYGSSGSGTQTVIVIVVVAAIALAVAGLIALLVIKRKKKNKPSLG